MAANKSMLKVVAGVAIAGLISSASVAANLSFVNSTSPSPYTIGIDPLVAVSLFGTAGSASAVQSVAAQQAGEASCPPGKVLRPPLANEPPGAAVCVDSNVPEAPIPPPAPSAVAFIPLIAAAAAAAGVAGAGHSNGSGNLAPISPE